VTVATRHGFATSADGTRGATAWRAPRGAHCVERWAAAGGAWTSEPTSARVTIEDQLLPLDDGTVLIRSACATEQVISRLEAGSVAADVVARIRAAGIRLLAPAGGEPRNLATLAVFDGAVTRFARLLRTGSLTGAAQLRGPCAGGVWLDRRGGRLLVTTAAPGRRSAIVLVDLERGEVSPFFSIGERSDERAELHSLASSLLVVRTNAGGSVRLGFAHLREGEPFWFPDATASPTGLAALALNQSGSRVLVHEQRGARSSLFVFDVARQRRTAVDVPAGSLAGRAAWSADGITVPWSTPQEPFALRRFDDDGTPLGASGAERVDVPTRLVSVAGAGAPLEAIAYGGRRWRTSRRLLVALHGGPADCWRYRYDPLFALLAHAGVCSLALNPSSSAGYATRRTDAAAPAFAGRDLADIQRVLHDLATARAGLAPPVLLGVSYGAYLALLAACGAPAWVTACVAVAPLVSPRLLHRDGGTPVRATIAALVGGGVGEPPDVPAIAHRLARPVLVLHGRDDDVIPVEHGRRLARALPAPRYVEVPRAGHDLLDGQAADEVADVIVGFVADVLGSRDLDTCGAREADSDLDQRKGGDDE
jgi:pimeloyl-ACP methyl ester carboxylesterase